jgi:hypothetical protein
VVGAECRACPRATEGAVIDRRRAFERAEGAPEAAKLALKRRALGRDAPDVARLLEKLGGCLRAAGDVPVARHRFEKALAYPWQMSCGAEVRRPRRMRSRRRSSDHGTALRSRRPSDDIGRATWRHALSSFRQEQAQVS